MAIENKGKPNTATTKGKKRKQYLPHNKAVKKKGAYPLRPGVQGFFITCDGGRERQAAHEAINVIDTRYEIFGCIVGGGSYARLNRVKALIFETISVRPQGAQAIPCKLVMGLHIELDFFEELVHGKDLGEEPARLPNKPLNKKITFSYSDDEDDVDEEEGDDEGEEKEQNEVTKSDISRENDASQERLTNKDLDHYNLDDVCHGKATEETKGTKEDGVNIENQADNFMEPPAKKQCRETDTSKCETNGKEKSIDKLIEAELKELGDKSKRRFINLDSGCNGVVFVQMRKKEGDPGPKDIAQHMMTSAASTRKHMSRFILRVLPVEVACYASEEEITRAIKPLIAQYFPVETQNPWKFAVLYEARANSGIDRMKIINSVAKSIPAPHKVDLSNPDMTIVVEIIKTVCLIGVVEKYKELAKFNLRQLTSPKQ
ncbi:THUMP domain-containing protein 1 isoform 1 [Theobroma cacao]|uniref:THUMP domain-containing protein 1 isoform 1 n=1 Tax=Theobroma cacao TaxID=3641 RepID=A0A061GZC0_THECC|nr:THUMP domain-containing protein 1 isoform 1 [Theobroma cacao]